jgi:hypothetical protein
MKKLSKNQAARSLKKSLDIDTPNPKKPHRLL